MNLTPQQSAHIQSVTRAKMARANARDNARMEADKLIQERTRSADAALDLAIRAAYDAGVPKRRIHLEGLGTTDNTLVRNALERTSGLAPVLEMVRGFDLPSAEEVAA